VAAMERKYTCTTDKAIKNRHANSLVVNFFCGEILHPQIEKAKKCWQLLRSYSSTRQKKKPLRR
jgi:hypothetical protein